MKHCIKINIFWVGLSNSLEFLSGYIIITVSGGRTKVPIESRDIKFLRPTTIASLCSLRRLAHELQPNRALLKKNLKEVTPPIKWNNQAAVGPHSYVIN
jgi:hypothetical protein